MGNIITHHLLDDLRSGRYRVVPRPHPTAKNDGIINHWVNGLYGVIQASEKFVLPDEVLAWPDQDLIPLMDSAEAMMRAGILRLPFPQCVVQIGRSVWIVNEMVRGDAVEFFVHAANRKDDQTRLWGYTIAIRPTLTDEPHNLGLGGEYDLGYDADYIPEAEIQTAIVEAARVVMCFIVMLNSRGIEVATVAPPAKLNKARRARGKSEIPGYTTVMLRPVGDANTGLGHREIDHDGQGRTRRSPRVHWRRGHISTRWGEPRWIQPVLVGRSENAFVEHRAYVVGGDRINSTKNSQTG